MRTGSRDVRRFALGLLPWILLGVPARAQENPPAEATGEAQRNSEPPATTPEPGVQARYADSIDVVAATPVDAWGVSRSQVPANVQSIGAADLARGSLASSMERLLPSVQLQEAQGSPWQPDIQVRGFSASPLLGVPQGVAVYQDGVRLNEPFGDTVRWDLVPTTAVARLDLLPGSNPLFGFNALGGALLLETKNGFSHPGVRGSLTGGSFGRRGAAFEWGLARSRSAGFLALSHLAEDGWRDFSPARIGQLFAGLSWAGQRGGASLSLSGADNRLYGNGPAPVALLEEDRSAVFTHPDVSEPEAFLLSSQLYRSPSPRLSIEANAFYRRQRLTTFNGDAASFEPCEEEDIEVWLCREGNEDDPLRATDGSLIPAGLAADAVENHTATDQWSAGGSLQVVRHAGGGTRTSRTAAGITADVGRADYAAKAELAELGPDRGTEGFGIELADSRDGVESRTSTTALYLLETSSLDARTTLVLSARWQRSQVRLRDRFGTALNGNHSFSRLSPALGLTRALGSRWTLYGNLGTSSRAPTPVELTCADPEDPCRLPNAFVSDPPLDQVVTRTVELGARGGWRGAEVAAAVFHTDSQDDILFISSGALTGSGHFANVGATRRQGAELPAARPAAARRELVRFLQPSPGDVSHRLLGAVSQSSRGAGGRARGRSREPVAASAPAHRQGRLRGAAGQGGAGREPAPRVGELPARRRSEPPAASPCLLAARSSPQPSAGTAPRGVPRSGQRVGRGVRHLRSAGRGGGSPGRCGRRSSLLLSRCAEDPCLGPALHCGEIASRSTISAQHSAGRRGEARSPSGRRRTAPGRSRASSATTITRCRSDEGDWLGGRDSNPDSAVQSRMSYH